jgi:ribosomal protein L29
MAPQSAAAPPPESLSYFTREAEAGVRGVLESQVALSAQIERLSTELHRLKEDAEMPALEPYTASLVSSRRRVAAVNTALMQIQERLTRLDKIAATLPKAQAEERHSPSSA